MALFEGILTGLAFIILIGPVLFTLLHSTLQYGFRSGMAVALGIFFSEIVVVSLISLGASTFISNPNIERWIAFIGAVVIIALGIHFLLKPKIKISEKTDLSPTSYIGFILKGFLINIINPGVFFIWLGIVGTASSQYTFDGELYTYLSGVLLGILLQDTLKAVFANHIKELFQLEFLTWFFRLTGVGLIGFGLRLLMGGMPL